MGYIPPAPPPPRRRSTGPSKASIAAVISAAAKAKIEDDAKAAAAAEAKAKAEAEAAAAKAAKAGSSSSSRRSKHKKLSREEREAAKEKQLLKLIGAVVVKCMSKYRDKMDHDQFKSYAKEVCILFSRSEWYLNLGLFVVVDVSYCGEREEVEELSGEQIRVALGGENGEDQEICKGVYSQDPTQA